MANKFTGTYTANTKTLNITKVAASGDGVVFKAGTTTTFSTSDGTAESYGSDVRVINASTVAAKYALDINAVGQKPAAAIATNWVGNGIYSDTSLTAVTAGKGADTITAHGNLTITTGGGKDVIALTSDTGTITITDYTPGTDVIRFTGTATNSKDAYAPNLTASTVGMDGTVTLTIGQSTAVLKNAKDKRITIVDAAGTTLMDQPFQRSNDLTLTNANSGTIASSGLNIDASARSKGIILKATKGKDNTGTALTDTTGQIVIGGKASDTIYASGANQTITSGKGNDYIVISSDTTSAATGGANQAAAVVVGTITDFTLGKKDDKKADRLIFGAGADFVTVKAENVDNVLHGFAVFSDTTTAKSSNAWFSVDLGTSAVWNQIKPSDYKNGAAVLVANLTDGKDTNDGYSITDPNLYVEAKITANDKLTIDLTSQVGTGNYTKPKISYEATSKPLNITAPSTESTTGLHEIFGGTGKDSLFGADSDTTKASDGTYPDTDNVGSVTLHGGKGNDLLNGGATAALLYGDEGNDTLRIGANNATVRAKGVYGAKATMFGGAGNDVFVFGGGDARGENNSVIIRDYTNVAGNSADEKAAKKALGTDKIVIANDKQSAKTAYAQASLTEASWSTHYEDLNGNVISSQEYTDLANKGDYTERKDLTLNYIGLSYVDSLAAITASTNSAPNAVSSLSSDGKYLITNNTPTGDTATIAGDFISENDGSFTIHNVVGQKVNIQNQGITYNHLTGTGEWAKDSQVTVNANYLGYLNPLAVMIDGSKSNKAMRLVANGAKVTTAAMSSGGYAPANVTASDTTIVGGNKADTLIGSKYMTGGKGNDVFIVGEGGAVITDYYGTETKKDKDKIVLSDFDDNYSVASISGSNVLLGNARSYKVTVVGAAGQSVNGGITFTYDENKYKINNKGVITGTQKVTHTMTREFKNGATIVAAGSGSTDLYTYNGNDNFDSDVAVVDISKGKGVDLHIASPSVFSIKGGAKADTISIDGNGYEGAYQDADGKVAVNVSDTDAIYAKDRKIGGTGAYFSDTVVNGLVTVSTGKGNDVININATAQKAGLYITDFTAGTLDRNKGTFKSGDVLRFSVATKDNFEDYGKADADLSDGDFIAYDSDVTVIGSKLVDVTSGGTTTKEFAAGGLNVSFDGSDVIIGNTRLANMKGKAAWISYGGNSIAEGTMVTLNNLTEVDINVAGGSKKTDLVKKGANFNAGLGVNSDRNVAEVDIKSIDASGNTKGAIIDGGKFITNITGGKGVDTIYAGLAGTGTSLSKAFNQTIDAAAGNDWIVFNGATLNGATGMSDDKASTNYTILDYTSGDRLYLDSVTIKSATISGGKAATTAKVKGKDVTTYYSDVALTVASTIGDNKKEATITLKNYATTEKGTSGFKLTQMDSLTAKANTFSLVYGASDITVGAADAAANATVDLTGAGGTIWKAGEGSAAATSSFGLNKVTVDEKRTKAVGFANALGGATIAAGSKAGVNVYGNEAATEGEGATTKNAITFLGNNKNDYYEGKGSADTVQLGSGVDTIFGGGKASVSAGAGNDIIIANANDAFYLTDYTSTDKLSFNSLQLTGSNAGIREIKFVTLNNTGHATAFTADTPANNKADALAITYTSDVTKATTETGAPTNDATVYLTGYKTDGSTAVALSTFSTNAAKKGVFTTLSNIGYGFASIAGDSNSNVGLANVFIGSTAADSISAVVRATMTGGKGNDTFIVASDTTITDFNASGGKDTLAFAAALGVKDFKLEDYGTNYIYEGGEDATILAGGIDATKTAADGKTVYKEGTIILKGVGNTTKKVTSAIRLSGDNTGVALSDQANIVLTNKNKVDKFNLTNTKTFDGTKNTSGVNFTASTVFESFVGSNKGDKLFFTTSETAANASKAGSVTLGGGNDEVTLGSAKQAITFTGGTDKVTAVIGTQGGTSANLSVSLGNFSVSSLSSGGQTSGFKISKEIEKTGNADKGSNTAHYASDSFLGTQYVSDVTFALKNGNKTGSIQIVGDTTKGTELFKLTESVTLTSKQKGGSGSDSDTWLYSWETTRKISGGGMAEFTYFTEKKEDQSDFSAKSDFTLQTASSDPYDEQFDAVYSPITAAETLYGSSEFDAITTPTTSIDINSLDFSTEALGGYKAGDLTFTTNLTKKQTK